MYYNDIEITELYKMNHGGVKCINNNYKYPK